MHGRDDTVLEQQFMAKSLTGYTSKPFAGRCRSIHAAAVRPLHECEPICRRDRRPRGDRVGQEDLSHRSEPDRDGRLLDGRRICVVLHRPLRGSLGRWSARCWLHGDGSVPARRPDTAAAERGCRGRSGTCTTRPTTRSTRSTCRSSRTPARSTHRNRPPTRWRSAMLEEGLKLEHIIGPNTGHAYEPGARQRLQDRLDEIASRGRNPSPAEIRFTTWMLRYNKMFWITVDAMGERMAAGARQRES